MPQETGHFADNLEQTNWLNGIMNMLQSLLNKSYEGIFHSMQSTLYNGVAYTVIITMIMFWLIMRLKNGYPTREELFEALKWFIMVLFIFGVFYSFDSYKAFISWFLIPADWVKSAVGSLFDLKANGDFASSINEALGKQNNLAVELWEIAKKANSSWWKPDSIEMLFTAFSLFFYWLYYIVFFIAVVGALCIVVGSQFIASLILSTAPIVIPFLVVKQLKPYFFSWLKLFISYSLYPSIALIILMLAMQPIADLNTELSQAKAVRNFYEHTFATFFPMTAITIFAIYLMTKIPNWVSQIMGVQGLDSGGVGGGLAMAKSAGVAAASGGVGGIIGAAKGAKGGFQSGGIGGAIKGALSGGMKGGASSALKTLPGAKTINAIRESIGSGINKQVSNGAGAVASAG